MKKSYKFRIYPTRKQETLLNHQLEDCRWLYNHFIAERKNSYETTGKAPGLYDQINSIPGLKLEKEGLYNVHSQVLQNVAVRVDLAFQAFFRRVKSGAASGPVGQKPGYPRFKGYGRYDSITFTQVKTGGCRILGDKLVVSKLGHIKIKQHRPIRGQPKTATITQSATGKWYVCFSCEGVEPQVLPENSNQVGIDVGLYTFASISDGTTIENPRFFRKEEKALTKAQRKLSAAEKGTPLRIRKQRHKVVARMHERIGFKRTNFSHQHSRKIVNSNGLIAVEDLQVNRMVHNHCLAKSISDAAWSSFFSMLLCKAEEAGRIAVKVNPAYTSQTCSACGHRQKLTLTDRVFNCPCCQLSIDRDHNASLNILALGLQRLGESPVDAPAFRRGE